MEDNGMPMINGQVYDWGMISPMIGGVLTHNMSGINYREEQEIEAVYAGGRKPVGYGKGRISCSGDITLMMRDVVALQSAAPGGRLQDIAPFDITVSYMHPTKALVHTDILKGCLFKVNSRTWSEGDLNQQVTLELLIGDIQWGRQA